jgi:hypothetical protein
MSKNGEPFSARSGSRRPLTSSRTWDERVERAIRHALSGRSRRSATIACREVEL